MSQQDGVTETIDGRSYTIYMLSPMVSHELLVDVAKMVGPAIGPVFDTFFSGALKGGGGGNILDMEVGSEFFTKAAGALFSGLDKRILKEVIRSMAEVTHVDGKPLAPIFDIHFRGKLDEMYKWLAFGMRVQWGKSLRALGSAVKAQGAAGLAEESRSQTT